MPQRVQLSLPLNVQGVTCLTLGIIELQPNQPRQIVALSVEGVSQQVVGVNFNIQVADGGPEVGGSIVGPKITGVDIIGKGTLFRGNHTSQIGGPLGPQIFEATTTTSRGTVEANGTLAFVTFDTTGFNSGLFDLLMDTLNGPTELFDTMLTNILTIVDGQILIVA